MNIIALKIPDQTSSNAAHGEPSTLGEMLGKLAKKKKMKQTDLARKCKISRISVNRFFRGRSEVRASDLVTLLRHLGIDLEAQIESQINE